MNKIVSAERGTLVTMVSCVNAIGAAIPPVFIPPRKRITEAMKQAAPNGSLVVNNPETGSAWQSVNTFLEFLEHFVSHAKPTVDSKCLMLLDNHFSHIHGRAINFCKRNGIILLTFPPHTTHKLQPLDVSVFQSFKKAFNTAINAFTRRRPFEPITLAEVIELTATPLEISMTPSNIQNGFKRAGIYPFNAQAFDREFSAMEAGEETENVTESSVPNDCNERNETSTNLIMVPRVDEETSENNESIVISETSVHNDNENNMNETQKSLDDIQPLPNKPAPKQTVRSKQGCSSRILADSSSSDDDDSVSYTSDSSSGSDSVIEDSVSDDQAEMDVVVDAFIVVAVPCTTGHSNRPVDPSYYVAKVC